MLSFTTQPSLFAQPSTHPTNWPELQPQNGQPAGKHVSLSVSLSIFLSIFLLLDSNRTATKQKEHYISHNPLAKCWRRTGLKLPFTFVVPGDWVFSLVFKSARAGIVLGMERQLLTGNQMLQRIHQVTFVKVLCILT